MRKPSMIIALCAVLLGIGLWGLHSLETESIDYQNSTERIRFRYPESLKEEELTDAQRAAGMFFKATANPAENSPVQLTLRKEEGLRKTASLVRRDLLDVILDSADKNLPQIYTDYQVLKRKKLDINGHSAASIIFEYTSPAGPRVTQEFIIILRDDDSAVYVSCQGKTINFDRIQKEICEPVLQTWAFD